MCLLNFAFLYSLSYGATQEIKKYDKKIIQGNQPITKYKNNNSEYPDYWHKESAQESPFMGANILKSFLRYPLIHSLPEVTIAVIDGGIDINHKDLIDKIWINKKEIPNNLIDDDSNGYIDDYMGWNFLGNKEGSGTFVLTQHKNMIEGDAKLQLNFDTLSETRKLNKLIDKMINSSVPLSKSENEELIYLRDFVSENIEFANEMIKSLRTDLSVYHYSKKILKKYISESQVITLDLLSNIAPTTSKEENAKKFLIHFLESSSLKELEDEIVYYQNQINYHFNSELNIREEIIQDDIKDLNQKEYGNNNVIGPDSAHGTHVAGIIAADEIGILTNAKILPIRAIPDGDERDKDIANSILYAVNNGAKVINMSFGKYYSENTKHVFLALKYAEEKNVLVVHAAGNEYSNNDKKSIYPTSTYNKIKLTNYLTIAASTPNDGEHIVASFSNYGKNSVDLLAPGEYIYSLAPDNTYSYLSGTSMAAPIVSAIAGMMFSVKPDLSPKEVISLIKNNMTYPHVENAMKKQIGGSILADLFNAPGIINLEFILNKILSK